MKKLILTMVVCLFTFSVVNAKTDKLETKEVKTEMTTFYQVNTFCKFCLLYTSPSPRD
mgnify:CR=1 FL=1